MTLTAHYALSMPEKESGFDQSAVVSFEGTIFCQGKTIPELRDDALRVLGKLYREPAKLCLGFRVPGAFEIGPGNHEISSEPRESAAS